MRRQRHQDTVRGRYPTNTGLETLRKELAAQKRSASSHETHVSTDKAVFTSRLFIGRCAVKGTDFVDLGQVFSDLPEVKCKVYTPSIMYATSHFLREQLGSHHSEDSIGYYVDEAHRDTEIHMADQLQVTLAGVKASFMRDGRVFLSASLDRTQDSTRQLYQERRKMRGMFLRSSDAESGLKPLELGLGVLQLSGRSRYEMSREEITERITLDHTVELAPVELVRT